MHLRELWRTLRKRKWLVLTLMFVVTTLVTIEMYRTKDVYQATTLIEVGKDVSRLGQSSNIFGDDYDPFYMVNIKTKMLMVRSHALLESVVLENHLDENPQFLRAGGKKSIWAFPSQAARRNVHQHAQRRHHGRAGQRDARLAHRLLALRPGDCRARD